MGGEGGRALREDHTQLAAIALEEADQHGRSPGPEPNVPGASRPRDRVAIIVVVVFGVGERGGGRRIEAEALDELR